MAEPPARQLGAVYSRRSRKPEDREAFRRGLTHPMRDHGTRFGINAGSSGFVGAPMSQGWCTIVEYVLSAETAHRIACGFGGGAVL